MQDNNLAKIAAGTAVAIVGMTLVGDYATHRRCEQLAAIAARHATNPQLAHKELMEKCLKD